MEIIEGKMIKNEEEEKEERGLISLKLSNEVGIKYSK